MMINYFKTTGALPQDQEDEKDPFAGLDEDDTSCTSLEELVQQIDPETTAHEYVNANDDLSTCLTFEHTDQWKEELRSMVCDETPSLSKQIQSDDEDDIEIERPSITSYEMALRISNDLRYINVRKCQNQTRQEKETMKYFTVAT